MVTLTHDDYTVGWICALPIELTAAMAMLDEDHESLPQARIDCNSYTLGRIGKHNVAIACLPAGIPGIHPAAIVAAHMNHTFRSIRFGFMVGIGGGVPSPNNDIRLGDVVVGKPSPKNEGVVQYDFGKTIEEGRFIHTGSLNRPPMALLTALAKVQANHDFGKYGYIQHLSEALAALPPKFSHCGAGYDQLFKAEYDHVSGNDSCAKCDTERLMKRKPRDPPNPRVFYGTIACGNRIMRHGTTRDRIAQQFDGLCFEMEAAGLMDNFPCVVIRGICDYADSHKNKRWQPYAAVAAAACAKELLNAVPREAIIQACPILAPSVETGIVLSSSASSDVRPPPQQHSSGLEQVTLAPNSSSNHDILSRSSRSTGPSGRGDAQFQDNIPQMPQNLNNSESSTDDGFLVAQRSMPSDPSTDTYSSSASTITLSSVHSNPHLSLSYSRSTLSSTTSSVVLSDKEDHSLSATIKAKFKRSCHNFIKAAKHGDTITLSEIVNDKIQRSRLDQKLIDEALIATAKNPIYEGEQTQMIKLLLSLNAELEHKDDKHRRTPLIWAVTVGREDIVHVLLENQALLETRDELEDLTPLMWAVWWGHEMIIRLLLDRGACLSATDSAWERTPLLLAAQGGNYEAASILLETNEGQKLIEVKDKEQLTPLALAYMKGHEHVADILLSHGANPNISLPSGIPLLISAITDGNELFVHLLISYGADIHCKDKKGIPALSVAVREDHLLMAQFLINWGASLEAKDERGFTALMWAVGCLRRDLVELLIESGANKFATDNEGRSVRGWAELTEDELMIELFSSGQG